MKTFKLKVIENTKIHIYYRQICFLLIKDFNQQICCEGDTFLLSGKYIFLPNKYKDTINPINNFCLLLEATKINESTNESNFNVWIPYCRQDLQLKGVIQWKYYKDSFVVKNEQNFWNL